jgi:DNA-binding NarL/FixJ family response regulator
MKKLQRILIVGGHPLLRAGLRLLLAETPDIEVLSGADGAREFRLELTELSPQLLLLDRSVPGTDGVESLAELKRRFPSARVLMVVPRKSEDIVQACMQAGVAGCVRHDATHEEFRAAIRSVLEGKSCLEVDERGQAAKPCVDASGFGACSGPDGLTPRERDVLKLVAAGKSSKIIAEMLSLSVKTVGKHRANLMAKLDLHNAAGLTAYAMKRGLYLKSCEMSSD